MDPHLRHVLNRFSYGATPALARSANRAGGPNAWLAHQMTPRRIDDRFAASLWSWFPSLHHSPGELYQRHLGRGPRGWEVMADFARWTLLRRIYSHRQLLEVMTEFWSNLLHVPAPDDKSWPQRIRYDQMIRGHALGRFDSLLYAAITHPAMGCYLDNAKSSAKNPNENLGRELLELHTVGRLGGYDEDGVRDSALILTGWHVDMRDTWRPSYEPADHYVGPVSVMGFQSANSDPDGRGVTRAYLHYLAHHPMTARRVAQRLAVRFVSDDPPARLVSDLARVFSESGTDITATLHALVRHRAFAESAGAKTRTPSEDLVASARVMGVRARKPTGRDTDYAHALLWESQSMGQQPFDWPRPDGFPDVADAWCSVSRMLGSWQVHYNLAGGWYPTTAVRYRRPAYWAPRLPARFDAVVNHVSHRILGRPASATLLDAACAATEIRAHERITNDHPLMEWKMPRLLVTVLDTPAHMSR